MNLDFIRLALGAAIVWYALLQGNAPSITPSAPYTGPMTTIHSETRSMDKQDQQGLSEALSAASKMLADDKAGLIKTTEELQAFTRGTLAYGYTSFALAKYPRVAAAVQAELEKATGDTVQAVTPEIRSRVAEALAEAGRAAR